MYIRDTYNAQLSIFNMRINQITFTRFIAAVSIVIFHYGQNVKPFKNDYVSFIFKQAYLGVSFFFVLSGFVMIIAYSNKVTINFINFIVNRLARIYPIYILAVIMIFINNGFLYIDPKQTFYNIIMIQSWVPKNALSINYPSWSLSVELFFYICFPFLFNYLYKKIQLTYLTIFIILFWIISIVLYNLTITEFNIIKFPIYNKEELRYVPLFHLNEFLIGNLAGIYFIKYLRDKTKNYGIAIIFSLIILILALKYPSKLSFENGLLSLLFASIIILISLSNDKITQFLSRKFFVFLGEISFGIYILQAPVWFIFNNKKMEQLFGLTSDKNFDLSFYIRFLILIILSTVVYFFFEKPIRNFIKEKLIKP